ncbi:MAG: efflux transporter outer membrane subunit [Akkermansia sp.]
MKSRRIYQTVALLATTLCVSSCMFGPTYNRPEMDIPAAFRSTGSSDSSVADLPWWKVFKNSDLQSLISDTYSHNRDLKAMMASVEQARQYVTVAQAPLFPWAGYGGSASKGANSAMGNLTNNGARTMQPGAVQASASWELDLWGKTRRQTESAIAEYLATEEAQRNLMLSLMGQVANGYLQLLQLDEQLSIMKDSVASYTESYRLFKEQMEGEVGDKLQVASAEAALAASQAKIPLLEAEIVSMENTLSVLAGRAPGKIKRSGNLMQLGNAVNIPAGIPAQILNRRPDIRQQEQYMRSANAKVGVAIANYFPSISLTAQSGLVTSDLRHVVGKSGAWGVNANMTGPLFQAGSLRASERMAKQEFINAKNAYEQTVLNALSEVSSTLVLRNKLSSVTTDQNRAVAAYMTAMTASMERYRAGLSDYFEVLYAQQNLFPSQIQLSQYKYQYAQTLVNLYIALGGGWKMNSQQILDASTTKK